MPTVLSKLSWYRRIVGHDWSFAYNCYEVGHSWTPSCTEAALEMSLAATIKIIPLYAALYGFSQLAVQRKYDRDATIDTLKSVIRSSCFIFFHAYQGSMLGCTLRATFGRFYYRVLVFLPAFLSSFLALSIEKPNRRQALAFYLINMASEIVYRMAVDKNYVRPRTHGETILFALSMSSWYYYIKKYGYARDPISSVARLLLGSQEAKLRPRQMSTRATSEKQKTIDVQQQTTSTNESSKRQQDSKTALSTRTFSNVSIQINHRLNAIMSIVTNHPWLKSLSNMSHPTCPHRHTNASCIGYVLSPMPSRFAVGYLVQALLRLSSRPLLLVSQPRRAFYEAFSSSSNRGFGLFLAFMVANGRLSSCCLRHLFNTNEANWHALVAGFVAGTAMLFAPRPSIAMYVMWKCVEQYYLQLSKDYKLGGVNLTIMTVYALSASLMLYTFALEPKYIRGSYMRFLDRMSDHRLHQLNRMVLDVFGTESSLGYEDYFPDLHPRYMSNAFKELIFNWMIQPGFQ